MKKSTISSPLGDVTPSLRQIDLKFNLLSFRTSDRNISSYTDVVGNEGISAFGVGDNIFYIGCLNGCLIRYVGGSSVTTITFEGLQNKQEKVLARQIFVDPTGYHAIVLSNQRQPWYVNRNFTVAHQLNMLSEYTINCVCWNRNSIPNNTKSILIGSQEGFLLECIIESNRNRMVRPLYDLKMPILSLLWVELTFYKDTENSEDGVVKNSIFCASPTTLHEFIGSSNLELLFKTYSHPPVNRRKTPKHLSLLMDRNNRNIRYEIPLDSTFCSLFLRPSNSFSANYLFWANSAGVFRSKINTLQPADLQSDSTLFPCHRIVCADSPPFFISYPSFSISPNLIVQMTLIKEDPHIMFTPFHFFFYLDEYFYFVSLITFQLVARQWFSPTTYGKPKKILNDKDNFWILTEYHIYHLELTNESDIARRFLISTGDFCGAYAIAHSSDAKDSVLCDYADTLFNKKKYKMAAQLYAMVRSVPFEDVCFKFLTNNADFGLLTYLRLKLLETGFGENKIRTCIFFVWIIQLHIQIVQKLQKQITVLSCVADSDSLKTSIHRKIVSLNEGLTDLMRKIPCIDHIQDTLYSILNTNKDPQHLVFLLDLRQDYYTLLLHCMQNYDYYGAICRLREMKKNQNIGPNPDQLGRILSEMGGRLFYHYPKLLVDVVLETTLVVVPFYVTVLIPTLLSILSTESEPKRSNFKSHSLRLLESAACYYVKHLDEISIGSKKVRSLIGAQSFEEMLDMTDVDVPDVDALSYQNSSGNISWMLEQASENKADDIKLVSSNWKSFFGIWSALFVFYADDPIDERKLLKLITLSQTFLSDHCFYFALRYCEEVGRKSGTALLYCLCGLHREAVEKCLANSDLVLAKYCASKPKTRDTRKSMWLLIAEHLASTNQLSELLMIVKEPGELRIQDVLPFLNEMFIEDLKDDICSSLDGYENAIKGTKQEIEEHTNATKLIEADIKACSQRCTVVSLLKVCDACQESVFTEKFYVFSCGDCFHFSCALKLRFNMTDGKEIRLKYEESASQFNDILNDGKSPKLASKIEKEIDELIGSDCFLCGHCLVSSINKPFINEVEGANEIASWKINSD